MNQSNAMGFAIGSFVLGALIVVGIFVVADVSMTLIVGPLIAVGIAAYASFRTAMSDDSRT